jgi:hypothetical protein
MLFICRSLSVGFSAIVPTPLSANNAKSALSEAQIAAPTGALSVTPNPNAQVAISSFGIKTIHCQGLAAFISVLICFLTNKIFLIQ